MNDISDMEGKNFSQILDEEPFRGVLRSIRLNKPQKAKALLEELRLRRYPRLKAVERRFQEKLESLSLPEGARIDHPAYFEAPGCTLQVRFRDGEQLMEKLRYLSQLPDLRELPDPLDDDD